MKDNNVVIRGNVGSDAKVIITEKDVKMTILSVAISNNYKNSENEYVKKDPTWVDVICFNNNANKASVIQKGERVSIEGKLSTVVKKNEKGENIKELTIIATDLERVSILRNTSMDGLDDQFVENLAEQEGF